MTARRLPGVWWWYSVISSRLPRSPTITVPLRSSVARTVMGGGSEEFVRIGRIREDSTHVPRDFRGFPETVVGISGPPDRAEAGDAAIGRPAGSSAAWRVRRQHLVLRIAIAP